MDLIHIEDYMFSFISFTGLSVVRPLNFYLEAMQFCYVIIGHLYYGSRFKTPFDSLYF